MGGLVFAGVNGAPTEQGNQPAIKAAPRVGAVYSFNDKTVLRGGWGLYYSPWNYAAAGTTGWGQIGYSATTDVPQPHGGVPTVTMSNPFPNGLGAAERAARRACSPAPAATSTSSIRTRARRACSRYLSTCSASCRAA